MKQTNSFNLDSLFILQVFGILDEPRVSWKSRILSHGLTHRVKIKDRSTIYLCSRTQGSEGGTGLELSRCLLFPKSHCKIKIIKRQTFDRTYLITKEKGVRVVVISIFLIMWSVYVGICTVLFGSIFPLFYHSFINFCHSGTRKGDDRKWGRWLLLIHSYVCEFSFTNLLH